MKDKVSNSVSLLMGLLILVVSQSCHQPLRPKDYLTWCTNPENGLVKQKTISDYSIEVQYLPKDYFMALSEVQARKDKEIGDNEFHQEHLQFQVKIKPLGGSSNVLENRLSDKQEFYQRVEYFNFLSEKDLFLVQNGDTSQCVLSHFENTYGLSPVNHWNIIFKGSKPSSDLIFIWFDNALGLGTIKFVFDKEDFKKIPTLVI